MTTCPDPATATLLALTPDQLDGALGSPMRRFAHRLDLAILDGDASLAALADELPEGWVVASPTDARFEDCRTRIDPPSRDALAGMVADVKASPHALRLYHLELLPGFRAIAGAVSAPIRGLRTEGGVQDINLALFLAPPGAVTSAHPDRHHNLLLQVAGTKDVWIEDIAGDPVARHRRGVTYFRDPGAGVPDLPSARLVRLGPGDGVYIPPMSFHWTRTTGEEGSVALSVGFSTTRTAGEVRLSQIDVSLHRLGWRRSRPVTPGRRLSRTKVRLINAIDVARGRPAQISTAAVPGRPGATVNAFDQLEEP